MRLIFFNCIPYLFQPSKKYSIEQNQPHFLNLISIDIKSDLLTEKSHSNIIELTLKMSCKIIQLGQTMSISGKFPLLYLKCCRHCERMLNENWN